MDPEHKKILDNFDPVRYIRLRNFFERFLKNFVDETVPHGEPCRERPTVFLPTHRSTYADSIVIGAHLSHQGISPPVVYAGENTFLLGLDVLMKAGKVLPIKKPKKGQEYDISPIASTTEATLLYNENLKFFFEGARSYPGDVLRPRHGIFRVCLQTAKSHPNQPMYFQPIGLNYENTIEATIFPKLLQWKAKMEERGKAFSFLSRAAGYAGYIGTDINEIIQQHGRGEKGDVFIQYTEPRSFQDFIEGDDLEANVRNLGEYVHNTLVQNFPFTGTNLVAYSLEDKMDAKSLYDSVVHTYDQLRERGANVSFLRGQLGKRVEKCMAILEERGCIDKQDLPFEVPHLPEDWIVNISDQDAISHYAAPVKQYLERT